MRNVLALVAIVGLGGCQPQTVQLIGTVFADRTAMSDPLPGAEITIVEPFEDEVLDQVIADGNGLFSIDVPAGASIVAEIRGEGLATSTFPGYAGVAEVATLDDHTLFGVPLAEVEAERALYAGCAGADDSGSAIVFGEMRIFGLQDPYNGDSPVTTSGLVDVRSTTEASIWEACYLSEDGLTYDPEADRTGETGRFGIFGVPTGLHEVNARYEIITEEWVGELYVAWIPPGDETVAVPMFPLWVPFEL